jgi:probable HAF family extracellular repeat protein
MWKAALGLLFIVGCGSTTGTPSDARRHDGGGMEAPQADTPQEISPTDTPPEISPTDVGDSAVSFPDAAIGNDAEAGTLSDGGVEQAPGTVCGSMVDIGTLDGGTYSTAVSVNERGEVLARGDVPDGTTYVPGVGTFPGGTLYFVWTAGTKTTVLGSTFNTPFSKIPTTITITGMNANGQLLGYAQETGVCSDFGGSSYVWLKGPAQYWTSLGSLGGDGQTYPYMMNARGDVIGRAHTCVNASCSIMNCDAFYWSQAGGMVDLGKLGPAPPDTIPIQPRTKVDDLDDEGRVVGSTATPTGDTHAFLWQSGKMTDLGTLPGGSSSEAWLIDEAGNIWGTSNSLETHIVRWSGGTASDLGAVPYVNSALRLLAINNRGQALLSEYFLSDPQFPHNQSAYFWENGRLQDLGNLGETNTIGLALTNSGRIVGASLTAQGVKHYFVWQDGLMLDLGPLGGSDNIYATESGPYLYLVGTSNPTTATRRAFIYTVCPPTGGGTDGSSSTPQYYDAGVANADASPVYVSGSYN